MLQSPFLNAQEEKQIVAAIVAAEKETSGEIRVHIDQKSSGDQLERAAEVFYKLKMDKTLDRNGVLFHISVDPKGFAIYGDEGIYKKVPKDFWEETKEKVIKSFRHGDYVQGLILGVVNAGKILSEHFPIKPNDENELPNTITHA